MLDVRFCAPFEGQDQIGRREVIFHSLDQALRVFGFPEFFFKHEQISFREVQGGGCVQGAPTLLCPGMTTEGLSSLIFLSVFDQFFLALLSVSAV